MVSLLTGGWYLGQAANGAFDSANRAITGGDNTTTDQHIASADERYQPEQAPTMAANRFVVCIFGAVILLVGAFLVVNPRRTKVRPSTPPEQSTEVEQIVAADELAFEKRRLIRRAFSENMRHLLHGNLKVRHVMSRQLTSVRPSAKAKDTLDLMRSKGIRHVVVTNREDFFMGVVTDQECRERENSTLARIMTPEPFSLDADSDFAASITTLIKRQASCLPVTTDGKLVGVLTKTDYLMALQCALQVLTSIAPQVSEPVVAERPNRSFREQELNRATPPETQAG